jgi:hypothetical protein
MWIEQGMAACRDGQQRGTSCSWRLPWLPPQGASQLQILSTYADLVSGKMPGKDVLIKLHARALGSEILQESIRKAPAPGVVWLDASIRSLQCALTTVTPHHALLAFCRNHVAAIFSSLDVGCVGWVYIPTTQKLAV